MGIISATQMEACSMQNEKLFSWGGVQVVCMEKWINCRERSHQTQARTASRDARGQDCGNVHFTFLFVP